VKGYQKHKPDAKGQQRDEEVYVGKNGFGFGGIVHGRVGRF
jgi:hypothetical protein